MGQQQLILLVLSVGIVGIAIVVGIRAFNENSIKANADAMTQDAVRIANDLQAWKQKPAPFGGQASCVLTPNNCSATVTQAEVNDPANFNGADFALMGYRKDATSNHYMNLNGEFELNPGAATTTIIAVNQQLGNQITVTLSGLSDTEVVGQIDCLGRVNPSDGSTCTLAF